MAKRRPLPTLVALELKYGPRLADPATRQRAINSLRSIVSDHRRHGVPDETNTVLAYVQQVAPGRKLGEYPRLRAAGLLDLPVKRPESPWINRTAETIEPRPVDHLFVSDWRRAAERLLERYELDVREITRAQIDEHLAREERAKSSKFGNERMLLDAFFAALVEAGRIHESPVPPRKERAIQRDDLAPEQQLEWDKILAYHAELELTRETESNRLDWYRQGHRWQQSEDDLRTLDQATWEPATTSGPDAEGGAERYARWRFMRNSATAKKSAWLSFKAHLRFIWRVCGEHDEDEVQRRIASLEKWSRPHRRGTGWPTRFVCRGRSVASAPAEDVFDKAIADINVELAQAIEAKADRDIRRLSRERLVLIAFRGTGGRLTTLASLRYCALQIHPRTRDAFFGPVIVKPSRDRDENNEVNENIIDRRGYADWVFNAEALPYFHADALLYGNDVMGWIESRGKDKSRLRWVQANDADPYGEITLGQPTSPVWWRLDGKGQLKKGGVAGLVVSIIRRRLGVEGGAHIFRRMAVMDRRSVKSGHVRPILRQLHMTIETFEKYAVGPEVPIQPVAWPEGRSVEQILGAHRSALARGATSELEFLFPHSVQINGAQERVIGPTKTSLPGPVAPTPHAPVPLALPAPARRSRLRDIDLNEFLGRSA